MITDIEKGQILINISIGRKEVGWVVRWRVPIRSALGIKAKFAQQINWQVYIRG